MHVCGKGEVIKNFHTLQAALSAQSCNKLSIRELDQSVSVSFRFRVSLTKFN